MINGKQKKTWWKERTVYQIYPRSFCDSNGDGIGDIPGIISKLDYLANLGIGIIWLSPVYKSPNDDNGYDISDYTDIQPDFGTMEDMKTLLSEAHKRDIKIIMDLVINHTSDEHNWFIESKKSKDNPYRNYYIWRPGKPNPKGGRPLPPNNWTSFFTGSVWQWDETTEEYYLHLFSKKQPDLNYKNRAVIEEVKKILHFWFKLGIDGFRCDVINVIGKSSLDDGKKRIALTGLEHYLSQKDCHNVLQELNKEVFSKYDVFTVGETVLVDPDMANDLRDPERKELDMIFAFEHMDTDTINNKWFRIPFNQKKFINCLCKWQDTVDWNANYFENHDQPRAVSHFGNDIKYREESAKMISTLLFTLRGTPYVYEGQELGMTNFDYTSMNELQDIESHNVWKMAKDLHFPKAIRWSMIKKSSRDNARTPMQWTSGANAGFSTGKPWLRPNKNYVNVNAEKEVAEKDSIFNFYKNLISLRKKHNVFVYGDFSRISVKAPVFAFMRELNSENTENVEINNNSSFSRLITVINYSKKTRKIPKVLIEHIQNGTILSTNYKRTNIDELTELLPYESFIIGIL